MLSVYQQSAAKCPTDLFQLAAIKLFVANVNIPVLLYAGFDVFVAITNPFHPRATVTALYLPQPLHGSSFYCLYFNPYSNPTFHFIFVLFCLHCGQVGMPAYMYIRMDIYFHIRIYMCMYLAHLNTSYVIQ